MTWPAWPAAACTRVRCWTAAICPCWTWTSFWRHVGPRSLVVALDQVEDPQNLGGIARSAAFLGADALILHRAHSAPLSPAASKASAGALEFFPVIEVPNLSNALQTLQKENFFVYGAALEDAVDYREVDRADRAVLVLGSEGEGLRSLTRKALRPTRLHPTPRAGDGEPQRECGGGDLVGEVRGRQKRPSSLRGTMRRAGVA